MHKLFLTFDTEDFISGNSISILHEILESLKRYNIKGLFFITGHMAEKLQNFPAIVTLLNEHQIGYHSSSHSVHPTIFEFTDVEDYEEAYENSLERETTRINPLTGNIEGRGGICTLRDLFPTKQISAFRAPGHCWSPPHLEALRSLGIRYDFSAALSFQPISYKNLTLYPYPIIGYWHGTPSEYLVLLTSLRHGTNVLTIHPSLLANQHEWDLIYRKSNPKKLSPPLARSNAETMSLLNRFDVLARQIGGLQKMHLIEVTPTLKKPRRTLSPTGIRVEKCYQRSLRWATIQEYKPRFLHQHFLKFFEINSSSKVTNESKAFTGQRESALNIPNMAIQKEGNQHELN